MLTQLPPAILQTLCEAMTIGALTSHFAAPNRSLPPFSMCRIGQATSEPIAYSSARKRDAYKRAIPWINKTPFGLSQNGELEDL